MTRQEKLEELLHEAAGRLAGRIIEETRDADDFGLELLGVEEVRRRRGGVNPHSQKERRWTTRSMG